MMMLWQTSLPIARTPALFNRLFWRRERSLSDVVDVATTGLTAMFALRLGRREKLRSKREVLDFKEAMATPLFSHLLLEAGQLLP